MIYQEDLKEQAATFYGATPEQMNLPYAAWAVLRDYYLQFVKDVGIAVPAGYTAAELDRDNPFNQWMEDV